MSLLVLARDGAVDYQCSHSRLLHSSCVVPVPLQAHLQNGVHDYGFRHLIYWSTLDEASAYVAFQSSTEVDWTPCGTDECWYY